jgi:rod shape-determining protein MreD
VTLAAPRSAAPVGLSGGRFTGFAATCVLAAILLEDGLSIGPARPDFALILLVYGAIRWGASGGAPLGFGLGVFRDALVISTFGLYALGMTLLGYAVGKLRDTLYLSAPAVDLLLVAGAKLALDILVLAGMAGGSWPSFESRFFWEGPLGAVYTALVGGLLHRLFRG